MLYLRFHLVARRFKGDLRALCQIVGQQAILRLQSFVEGNRFARWLKTIPIGRLRWDSSGYKAPQTGDDHAIVPIEQIGDGSIQSHEHKGKKIGETRMPIFFVTSKKYER